MSSMLEQERTTTRKRSFCYRHWGSVVWVNKELCPGYRLLSFGSQREHRAVKWNTEGKKKCHDKWDSPKEERGHEVSGWKSCALRSCACTCVGGERAWRRHGSGREISTHAFVKSERAREGQSFRAACSVFLIKESLACEEDVGKHKHAPHTHTNTYTAAPLHGSLHQHVVLLWVSDSTPKVSKTESGAAANGAKHMEQCWELNPSSSILSNKWHLSKKRPEIDRFHF